MCSSVLCYKTLKWDFLFLNSPEDRDPSSNSKTDLDLKYCPGREKKPQLNTEEKRYVTVLKVNKNTFRGCNYSRTSVARTLMARLPGPFRTLSLLPRNKNTFAADL